MTIKQTRLILSLLLLVSAAAPITRAESFTLTSARLQCSNLSDWSATLITGTAGFEAGGGTDGACDLVGSGNFGLDFGWLLSPFATADTFSTPDGGLALSGFISVTGPLPRTPHKTKELLTKVTWTTAGGGSTPDGLVDFTFSGAGTGTGYFDYTELSDHSVRLDEVAWVLTAALTGSVVLSVDPAPVPEPASIWLVGLVLVLMLWLRWRSSLSSHV